MKNGGQLTIYEGCNAFRFRFRCGYGARHADYRPGLLADYWISGEEAVRFNKLFNARRITIYDRAGQLLREYMRWPGGWMCVAERMGG